MLRSITANEAQIVVVFSTEQMQPSKEKPISLGTNPNAAAAEEASADGDFWAGVKAITLYLQTIAISITFLEGDLASISSVFVVPTHIMSEREELGVEYASLSAFIPVVVRKRFELIIGLSFPNGGVRLSWS